MWPPPSELVHILHYEGTSCNRCLPVSLHQLPEGSVSTPPLSLEHNHTTNHHDNHPHGNQTEETHSERSSVDSTTSPLSAFYSTSQLGGGEVAVGDGKVGQWTAPPTPVVELSVATDDSCHCTFLGLLPPWLPW